MIHVISFETFENDSEESYFICQLSNNRTIDISYYSLINFAMQTDSRLSDFSERYSDWESLIHDLLDFEYDFINIFNHYIAQFTDEDLEQFTYNSEYFDELETI